MSARARLVTAICGVALGACECPGTGTGPGAAPLKVLSVAPIERRIPLDARFVVNMSAEVSAATATSDTVILIPTARVNESLLSDLANPPLSESRRDDVIPASLRVETNGTITLTPVGALPAATELSLLLSKAITSAAGQPLTGLNGEPGHHQVDYVTVAAGPVIVETSLPSGSPSQVPPNLSVFTLTADQPLVGAADEAVAVRGLEGAADVEVDSVEVLSDGVTIRVTLRSSGECQPLCPSAGYRIEAGPPLANLDGAVMTPFSLELRALPTPDETGPALVFLPFIRPSETDASVNVISDEPATGRVLVGPPGGPYPESFPLTANGFCTGIGAARQCPSRATVTGLNLGGGGLGRSYGAQVELVDGFGNVSLYGEFEIRTVRLPLIVVTEVYNNPPGEEETQEFVEIENISPDQSYDLLGMWLGKLNPDSGAVTSDMELEPYGNSSTVLGPGQRMVLGGGDFDPRAIGTPEDALVMTGPTATLLGGLESGQETRKDLALFLGPPDEGAAIVSIFRAPAGLYEPSDRFPEGVSAERADPATPDDEALWCHSAGTPTPAQPNSVSGLTACP